MTLYTRSTIKATVSYRLDFRCQSKFTYFSEKILIPLLHCNGLSCSHHCTENTSHILHDMSQTHKKIYCKVLHIDYSKFIKEIFYNIIHTSCDLMKSNNIKTIKTKIHLLCPPSPIFKLQGIKTHWQSLHE